MTLEEYVLRNYTVKEFYENNLTELDVYDKGFNKVSKKYKAGFNSKDMAICPLHDDHDPSFGLIKSKKYKGVLVGHCFGCGKVVDVIRLNQQLINKGVLHKEYHENGQVITYDESAKLLAKEKGLSLEDVKEEKLDLDNLQVQREIAIRKARERYSLRDFQNDLLAIRMSKYNTRNKISMVNRSLVKVISESNNY